MQIIKLGRKKYKLLPKERVENYILAVKSVKENRKEKMNRFHYINIFSTSLSKNPYHGDIKK